MDKQKSLIDHWELYFKVWWGNTLSHGIRNCSKPSSPTTIPRTGLSPFTIIYGSNPRAPLDLAPIPDMTRTNTTTEDLMTQIQEGHKLTIQKLQESTDKYKASADKKRRAVEFEE
jgi:hypothetical protein